MTLTRSRRFLVFVLPVLILVASRFLMEAHGPFYTGLNEDPDYVYLFNSLLLLHSQAPAHIDHPGTTVQELGAAVIFVRGILAGGSTSVSAITTAVLKDPEPWLRVIQQVVMILVAGCFAWTGWKLATWRGAGFACLFQTVCIGIASVVRSFVRVSPEPLLFAAALLTVASLQMELSDRDERRLPPVLLGLSLGFGIATKITFAPLFLLIFGLRTPMRRLAAALTSGVSLLLFTLPLATRYPVFLDWVVKLALHKDRYGAGDIGVPSSGRISDSAAQILALEPLAGLFLLELIVVAVLLFRKRKQGPAPEDRVILAGAAALLLQVLLTLKHPGVHYLLPVVVVAAWLHLLAIDRIFGGEAASRARARAQKATVALSIASVLLGLNWWLPMMLDARRDGEEVSQAASRERCGVVGMYGATMPAYALSFGNALSRHVFAEELSALYPGRLFYNIWKQRFYTFEKDVTDAEAFALPGFSTCMLLQGPPVTAAQRFKLTPLLVRTEVLYRVEADLKGAGR